MPKRGSWFRPGILFPLLVLFGLLPVLPMLIKGSPVLNNDMLVAYFCYFWDFHRNWSWDNPLVFWSSSYQAGMPMHAYWQSGFLYPVTWILFGPLSPHIGIHLFYAFHFALGMLGFLALGPHLRLRRPAALWAGIAFALGGTMLARYEHATFLAGWAWMPLVLQAFLALRDRPGPGKLLLYASAVALQALGGHPQASATTAVLIGAFTVAALFRRKAAPGGSAIQGNSTVTSAAPRRLPWMAAGHALALLYCAPLVFPFLDLVERTNRFDGAAWEGEVEKSEDNEEKSAGEKLEEGVFGFEKFSTGGFRPLHALSLGAAHALGSPSNASWWGGEVWGEVFVYMGVLGLFFACFASWKRAGPDLRLLILVGILGLWFSCGAHLGASQILYHVPVFNNFRRPARFLILVAFALAALSGHGFQRWAGRPRGRRVPILLATAGLLGSAVLLALRYLPEANGALLGLLQAVRKLDPSKDYAGKLAALEGRLAVDFLMAALSGAALWWAARGRPRGTAAATVSGVLPSAPGGLPAPQARPRAALVALFSILLLDLLRIHWDHFYLFPSSFYRDPPATAAVLEGKNEAFWRVSHYLEYPGLEMWRMHNDPLAAMDLFEREKAALSYGIHAVFGHKHVGAHLPLVWKWEQGTGLGALSGRYFFSNRDLPDFHGEELRFLGRFGEVRAYEVVDWKPRIERLAAAREWPINGHEPHGDPLKEDRATEDPTMADSLVAAPGSPAAPDSTVCETGYQGYRGLCVREERDGEMEVKGAFLAGDTLLIRERAYPGWIFSTGSGPWQKARETREHFLAVPIAEKTDVVRIAFVPFVFYRWAGIGAIATGLIAIFAFFRSHRRSRA